MTRGGKVLLVDCGHLKTENYPFLRVFSDHFVDGKPAPLYEEPNPPDWVSSLQVGHGKKRSALLNN